MRIFRPVHESFPLPGVFIVGLWPCDHTPPTRSPFIVAISVQIDVCLVCERSSGGLESRRSSQSVIRESIIEVGVQQSNSC